MQSNLTRFIFRALHQPSAAENAGCELLETSPLLIQLRERLCPPREQQCSCVCRASKPSFALLQTPPVALDLGLGRIIQGRSPKHLAPLRRLHLDLGNAKNKAIRRQRRGRREGKREGGREEREGGRKRGGEGEGERTWENIHLYLHHLATEEKMQKPPLKSGEYSNQPACYKLEPVSITMYINSHTSF